MIINCIEKHDGTYNFNKSLIITLCAHTAEKIQLRMKWGCLARATLNGARTRGTNEVRDPKQATAQRAVPFPVVGDVRAIKLQGRKSFVVYYKPVLAKVRNL